MGHLRARVLRGNPLCLQGHAAAQSIPSADPPDAPLSALGGPWRGVTAASARGLVPCEDGFPWLSCCITPLVTVHACYLHGAYMPLIVMLPTNTLLLHAYRYLHCTLVGNQAPVKRAWHSECSRVRCMHATLQCTFSSIRS